MNQNANVLEGLDLNLAEINEYQRRELLLCIDEILVSLDTESPAGVHWKTARRNIQLIEGNKFAE